MGWLTSLGSALAAPFVLPSALSMGGSIIDYFASDATNRQNAKLASDANDAAGKLAAQNMIMQKEFAQNGIQWRVQDAEKAGIAPLAALGASTAGYSPVTAAFNAPQYSSPLSGLSHGLNMMGQNISRAIAAVQSPEDRIMTNLNLRKAKAETNMIEDQAKLARFEVQSKIGPPNPATPPSTVQYFKKPDGSIIVEPSKEYKESVGSSMFDPGAAAWWIENKALPFIGVKSLPDRLDNAIDARGDSYHFVPVANIYTDK